VLAGCSSGKPPQIWEVVFLGRRWPDLLKLLRAILDHRRAEPRATSAGVVKLQSARAPWSIKDEELQVILPPLLPCAHRPQRLGVGASRGWRDPICRCCVLPSDREGALLKPSRALKGMAEWLGRSGGRCSTLIASSRVQREGLY
jgi:hypothetical protein